MSRGYRPYMQRNESEEAVSRQMPQQMPQQPMPTHSKVTKYMRTDAKEFDAYDDAVYVILNEVQNTLRTMAIMHEIDSNYYCSKGLHGFKRWHRYYKMYWDRKSICIQRHMVDDYHLMPMVDIEYHQVPKESTMQEHMFHYHDNIEKTFDRLNELCVNASKIPDMFIVKLLNGIICDIKLEWKYVDRHKHYCMDIEWEMESLHWYSDKLHEKIKCLEKSDFNYDGDDN